MTDERLSHRRPGVEASVRTAAIWATVAEHASRRQAELDRPLTVLDLGGGSGGLAVPLALEGHEVDGPAVQQGLQGVGVTLTGRDQV